MALFGIGKKDTETKPAETEAKKVVATSARSSIGDVSHILKSPRITEKATMHAGISAYVFDVADNATKQSVASAVFRIYNVRPRMVRVLPIPKKTRRNARTGKSGVTRGGKKAYVYLKKGDTITIT